MSKTELPPIVVTPNPPPPVRPPVVTFPTPQLPPAYIAKPLIWDGKLPQSGQYEDFFNRRDIRTDRMALTVAVTIATIERDMAAACAAYLPQVPADVDAEVATAVGDKVSGLEKTKLEKAVVDAALEQAEKLLGEKIAVSRAFYGREFFYHTKVTGNGADFANKLYRSGREPSVSVYRRWEESARAAFQTRVLREKIRVLKEKSTALAAAVAKGEEEQRQAAEALKAANTYRVPGKVAAAAPMVTTAAGTVTVINNAITTLQGAIRAAMAALAGFAASTAAGLMVGVTALVYSPKLANGERPERYSLSTPLSDLAPGLGQQELEAAAAVGGMVDMPYRLSSKTAADGQSEVIVVKTDNVLVSSKVRVVAATYDAAQKLYTVSTGDVPARTLTWTPIADPIDSSSSTPVDQPLPPIYTGASVTPVTGRIDTFPGIVEAGFNDFITVFPADSGLPPIYIMFREPREDAGTASGMGQPVSGVWLGEASQGKGAPVPTQIADQLRGKQFDNFRGFREQLWINVASDPVLAGQFNAANLARMNKGLAPRARKADSVGGRRSFEIHHTTRIVDGGEVYDIDNMRIVTPKRHIEIHSGVE
ncbi:S-type pyocin domain-containing protein [Metapseudomonas otitidis]|uniref:S-type pyocin domain-containing protein n=1 Tax=Metapseudomonas otitidis TaxID=319939 RepID=UPI0013F63B82|nr:S-type pyocin domain-containing protein [Pseudomonas otitidis]